MKSKTIIISQQSGSGRGILTLYLESDLLKSKLRLYSVPSLKPSCKLAIFHQDEVTSANLISRGSFYETSLVGNFDLEKDFYCAIVDTEANNQVLLSGGTYAGYFFDDGEIFPQEKLTTETKEDQIKETCTSNCENCKYKEYFYSSSNQESKVSKTIFNVKTEFKDVPISSTAKQTSLIESLTPQFEYIFKNFPPDTELNTLIKDGKFVKMNEGADQYSIGAIYENDKMKYICYAVKASFNQPAPEELGKFHQWLPLDQEDPLSDGFHIVYQDATDLKILEV